ncbi:anti-oxidant AhpCTSA family protein [Longibacter salinarum]|uniref:Anti-oxidant AhpCTSA family protein n=1 Tax=Longibacter salinarum TaxID=1850348 RepID=A0A2A8D2K7_9BACT|nr:peroxiredoxin [Longibacter salinarum]PEN15057.1 anti-oxidant AhpCTSA family protein [Longibacter salinarum]
MPETQVQAPRVDVSDQAPDFTLFTHDMEPWKLSDKQGQPVVLLFFPGAFTSVCTTELNTVNNEREDFGAPDVEIAGISTDSPFVLDEFRKVNDLQFALLSDHDAEVAEAYGVKYSNDFTPMGLDRIAKRAAFVIDADGVIQYAEVTENAGVQPDFDVIKEVLANL